MPSLVSQKIKCAAVQCISTCNNVFPPVIATNSCNKNWTSASHISTLIYGYQLASPKQRLVKTNSQRVLIVFLKKTKIYWKYFSLVWLRNEFKIMAPFLWMHLHLTCTGMADVYVAPLSTIRTVARPLENAARIAFLTTRNTGTKTLFQTWARSNTHDLLFVFIN